MKNKSVVERKIDVLYFLASVISVIIALGLSGLVLVASVRVNPFNDFVDVDCEWNDGMGEDSCTFKSYDFSFGIVISVFMFVLWQLVHIPIWFLRRYLMMLK